MSRRMSAMETLSKIEWEGSLIGAIEYGLKAEHVPPLVADEWQQVMDLMEQVESVCANIVAHLEIEAEGEYSALDAIRDPDADDDDEEA